MKQIFVRNNNFDVPKTRKAKVPHMFENVKVVVGSEENIMEEVYMTCILQNNRVVKFRKGSLEFV